MLFTKFNPQPTIVSGINLRESLNFPSYLFAMVCFCDMKHCANVMIFGIDCIPYFEVIPYQLTQPPKFYSMVRSWKYIENQKNT